MAQTDNERFEKNWLSANSRIAARPEAALFTPGPWSVGNDLRVGAVTHPIANVWKKYIGAEKAEANARLIAAAPEMFEALELVRLCGGGGARLSREASDKVKAALRKATGEA